MKTYMALFLLAFGFSVIVTPYVRVLAVRRGVLDRPDPRRKIHAHPIPRLGGVALYIAFVLALALVLVIENRVSAQVVAHGAAILKILAASTLILALGLYDDLRRANARLKLTVQAAAAVLLYALGVQITRVWNPWGGVIELGPLALPVTVFWLVGITNAFNLIDGLDGLSAGAALFATLTLLTAALFYDQPAIAALASALAGSIAGFLRYNFAPASIFLGDSGSLFLGFLLGALAIEGSQKSATAVAVAIPLVAFGLPVTDTLWTLVRRAVNRRPLFQGDLEHIHHMLLRRGFSHRQVVILLYAVCAACGLFSLLFLNPQGKVMGALLFIFGASIVWAIHSLGYPEAHELRVALGRIWHHPRAVARGIRMRRLIAEMDRARSALELWQIVQRVAEEGGLQRIAIRWNESASWEFVRSATSSRPEDDAAAPDRLALGPILWSVRLPVADQQGGARGELLLEGIFGEHTLLDLSPLCLLLRDGLQRALARLAASEREDGRGAF